VTISSIGAASYQQFFKPNFLQATAQYPARWFFSIIAKCSINHITVNNCHSNRFFSHSFNAFLPEES
jgi:hypothetical protein